MNKSSLLTMALYLPASVAFASEAELNERLTELEERLNATAEMVEGAMSDKAASDTYVGGYGEMHYSKNKNADDKVDFHRFVLFFGHQYTDSISFKSELELEHGIAGESQPGTIELEQAYMDVKLNDKLTAVGGAFLIPMGIVNETHEPNTFYGVERNPVEKNIIPSTWWAAGTGVKGVIAKGWSYDAYAHSGLKSKNYNLRSGRQKVGNAIANDFAYTGRIKYTGIPGLEVAGSLQYQSDITQGTDSTAGSAVLYESHIVFDKAGFGLRALYAAWSLSGDGPKSVGADKQNGWYVEPSYKMMEKYGVFARYSQWNNAAGSNGGEETTQTNVGVSYWPDPKVVVKADYMTQGAKGEKQAFNVGLGYQF